MLKVEIFRLGFVEDVRVLDKVARLVNASKGAIHLEISDDVENIGDPDLYSRLAYSKKTLFKFFPPPAEGIVRAGIIMSPIERNFFTLTKGLNSIVISLFEADEVCEKAGKTIEEYITYTLLMEILSFQFQARSHGQLLFSIDSALQAYLDALDHNTMPENLLQKFKSNEISLSQGTIVSTIHTSTTWWINDGIKAYLVKKEDRKLNVYQGSTWIDIMHDQLKGCIFDLAGLKLQKAYKLKRGYIEPMCRGKLINANVPESLVRTVEQILRRIRRPTFIRSLTIRLQNPLFSFFLGGLCLGLVINALTSFALGELNSASDYCVLGGLLFSIVAVAIGNYIWTLAKATKN